VGVPGEINLGEGLLTKKQEGVSGNLTTNRNPGCLKNPGSLPKSIGQKNQEKFTWISEDVGG
jgi:hypothetical protein